MDEVLEGITTNYPEVESKLHELFVATKLLGHTIDYSQITIINTVKITVKGLGTIEFKYFTNKQEFLYIHLNGISLIQMITKQLPSYLYVYLDSSRVRFKFNQKDPGDLNDTIQTIINTL